MSRRWRCLRRTEREKEGCTDPIRIHEKRCTGPGLGHGLDEVGSGEEPPNRKHREGNDFFGFVILRSNDFFFVVVGGGMGTFVVRYK